jgi:hypothetical protein
MAISRAAIFDALAARFWPSGTFQFFARRPVLWDNIQPSQMPALLLLSGDQRCEIGPPGSVAKWTLEAQLVVLAVSDPEAADPLDPLLDVIEVAMAAAAGDRMPLGASGNTLGGLVSSCLIAGPVEKFVDSEQISQSVATVPIEIVVAA